MTPHHVPVPTLGPKPQGDVGAMRAMATQCIASGKEVGAATSEAASAVNGMSFSAPAATRLRGAVLGQTSPQAELARSLNRFGLDLNDAADQLEAELKAYEARRLAVARAEAHNAMVDRLDLVPTLGPLR